MPSEAGTVDPAPASLETDVPTLASILLDHEKPLFERFRCIFGLRNLRTDEAALALGHAMIVDRSALLRHECAYVLGQMQLEASIPHLVQALRGDPNPMVRHEAAEALGAIGTPSVVPILEHYAKADPAVEVRESCTLALDHLAYLRDPKQL